MNIDSRLGPRLTAIFELIIKIQQNRAYPVIWDCCCDHGYLGIKILQNNCCEQLKFVDKTPHIIEALSDKLASFDIGNHELLVADAAELHFSAEQRHLVILAGVGTETLISIINKIEASHPTVQIDYILCPSTIKPLFREYLFERKWGVYEERLVCARKRYYEIVYVQGEQQGELDKTLNRKPDGTVLPTISLKSDLWDKNNPDHQRFLTKINKQRKSKRILTKA